MHSLNMADSGSGVLDMEKLFWQNKIRHRTGVNMMTSSPGSDTRRSPVKQDAADIETTTEYCRKLQEWMWRYYYGYVNWMAVPSTPLPLCSPPQTANGASIFPMWGTSQHSSDVRNWYNHQFPFAAPGYFPDPPNVGAQTGEVTAGTSRVSTARPVQEQLNGNVQRPGREYNIPSPLQRFVAEMVDFFILFFVKATIILSIMHLSGMKDISKFAMHFIVEEINEDTSIEDLQTMMLVALTYRVLVCFYEIICIWGVGGATPGKFLLGLRVVTCDTSVLVRPNRVLVVPATNVKLSASTVRALNKNFSIALFFPAFITLLFFQHNRTVYDIVAGTIVVKRR